jgi:hypothetical protein
MRWLLPLESVALFGLFTAISLAAVFSLTFYVPDTHSSAFALEHYLAGVFLSLLLLIAIRWRDGGGRLGADFLQLARNIFALTLIVYLHFNFKLWAQIINPYNFDAFYYAIDQAVVPLGEGLALINLGFAPLKAILPDAYHDVFVFMFLTTFIMLSVTGRREAFEGSLLAVALVLVIGGLAYIPAPALGPFFHLPDSGTHADAIQQAMLEFQRRFVASHGRDYHGGNFIMPLAAMPSLHVAHAFVLLYYAWRHLRWLGYVYLPLFIFLTSEAVVSRWHYLIDLPAGLAIAGFCLWLSQEILRKRRQS